MHAHEAISQGHTIILFHSIFILFLSLYIKPPCQRANALLCMSLYTNMHFAQYEPLATGVHAAAGKTIKTMILSFQDG